MRFSFGSKRFVVVLGNYAVKFGRIRVLKFLSRFIVLPFSVRRRRIYLAKYGGTWKVALMNDLFAGLVSNRNEYEYFTKHKGDQRIMPVIRKYLGGHIIVQLKGDPVTEAEIEEQYRLYRCTEYRNAELDTPGQFGRHSNGQIKIVDYGNRSTIDQIEKELTPG